MLYNHPMTKTPTPLSLEKLFRVLADPTRLRLLNLIADQEICVCYLVEILGISQPKVSRHLAYLRRAGFVETRREGKWMHYRLTVPQDAVAAQILHATLMGLRKKPEMRRDSNRLKSACCSSRKPETLQEAPMPIPLSDRSVYAPSDHRR
jgi:ArsR family transcriptional regulator, arsenate/arsenite/antimonite-responsive transcriptional repressor